MSKPVAYFEKPPSFAGHHHIHLGWQCHSWKIRNRACLADDVDVFPLGNRISHNQHVRIKTHKERLESHQRKLALSAAHGWLWIHRIQFLPLFQFAIHISHQRGFRTVGYACDHLRSKLCALSNGCHMAADIWILSNVGGRFGDG